MKILFLTICKIDNIDSKGIYTDLLRKFSNEGHEVIIVTPTERRYKQKTAIIKSGDVKILMIKTFNIQKTNLIEKGLSTLLVEYQFLFNIKKLLSKIHFDLVLYSTPPVTFVKVVTYIKQRDQAMSYLLLKDIFPQNAIDLGMIRYGGLIHKYFRKKEKDLYSISDHIGCMSPANVSYLRKNNPEINPEIIEVNPNSIDPVFSDLAGDKKISIRKKYGIPYDAKVFIYGGNIGKPQGISFLIEVLNSNLKKMDIFFAIVGTGTEYSKIKSWFEMQRPENASLISGLQKDEFDLLLQSCDVGMIFLDHRFTIPNFPSRLLTYLEFKKPVIAASDPSTDLGEIIERNGFGLWSLSGDILKINQNISELINNPGLMKTMGETGYRYLMENYNVDTSYKIIMDHI